MSTTMPQMWEHVLFTRTGSLWQLFDLWRLRQVFRRRHGSNVDPRNHIRAGLGGGSGLDSGDPWYNDAGRGGRIWDRFAQKASASPSSHNVYGSLALMPAIIPNSDKADSHGHKMIFRTVPFPESDKIVIFGCEHPECQFSTSRVLQRMALEYGIRPMEPAKG